MPKKSSLNSKALSENSAKTPLSPYFPRPEGGDLVHDVLFEYADARGQHGRPEEDVGDAGPRVGLADADAAITDGEDGNEAAEDFEQFLDLTYLPGEIQCVPSGQIRGLG